MTNARLGLLVCVLLTSCTTTEQAKRALDAQFVGKPIDEFFLRHGPPVQQHKTQDGKTIYVWNSNPASQGTARPVTFCEVQLVADSAAILRSVTPRYDSIGQWTTSYCAELFK
jgi:hypothetical protein